LRARRLRREANRRHVTQIIAGRELGQSGKLFVSWHRVCQQDEILRLREVINRQAEQLEMLNSRPSPLRLNIKIRPGVVTTGACRTDHLRLEVPSQIVVTDGERVSYTNIARIFLTDVQRQLLDAGIFWGSDLERGLDGARFLFRGVELKPDAPLLEQGVRDGAEILVIKAMTPLPWSPLVRPSTASPYHTGAQTWRTARHQTGVRSSSEGICRPASAP